MKTHRITKDSEYIKDKGTYYLLTKRIWECNLNLQLDKKVVCTGDLDCTGDLICVRP